MSSVSEFRYEEKPIRSFRRTIEGRLKNKKEIAKVGEVQILLSATRIEESKTEMRNRMLSFAIPICLIAAFSSFFLAAFFARPIKALARDLKQITLGHLEHQSKVTSNDEIGELAKNFNQMASGLKTAQDLLIIQKANEHELSLATKIQQRLLPSKTPRIPHFDLASYYEAAKQIGGDYYDFIRIDKEHLGVVVADVSGKGVPGSLVMTMTRGLLRMAAKNNTDPIEVIQSLNKALTQDIPTGMFVTLLYFILHVPSKKLTLVRAGHNAPLLISQARNKAAFLGPDGIALGLDPSGMIFNNKLKPQRITLQAGDVLVNYTDGIIEAKDSAGNDYTEKRFCKIIKDNLHLSAEDLKTKILEDVAKHTKGYEQSDDITLVVLKVV